MSEAQFQDIFRDHVKDYLRYKGLLAGEEGMELVFYLSKTVSASALEDSLVTTKSGHPVLSREELMQDSEHECSKVTSKTLGSGNLPDTGPVQSWMLHLNSDRE